MRSNLLRAGDVLDSAALDKYSFTRDVFLQVRSQRAAGPGRSGDGTVRDDDDASRSDGMLPPEPAQ